MAEARFTKGPWKVAGKATGRIHYAGADPEIGTVEVATVGDYRDKELLPFNRDRWDADARLIAAAPELFEAAEPFSIMAGELFAQNWNAEDIVFQIVAPGQRIIRVTAGDFFKVRAALSKASPSPSSEDA